MDLRILFELGIILIATKTFGLFTRRIHLPQVVGALLAGIIIGPSMLNLFKSSDVLNTLAELGVILLMFTAGMETNLTELRKNLKASLNIAAVGVLVPLIGGFILAHFFGEDILKSIFIGVILTATSVSITVETLVELKKIKTKSGTAILGAAIIDDILGIIILSVIISVSDTEVSLGSVGVILIKIVVFFVLAAIVGFFVYKFFAYLASKTSKAHRLSIYALAFCLLLAYTAELFGIANITGAYIAGLILCNCKAAGYIEQKTEVLSYMLFSPIFFASIGLKISFSDFSGSVIVFSVLLLIVAILTKIVGCGLGAYFSKFTKAESVRVGIGMVSRGEVALIVADKGMAVGLMNPALFSGVVLVVIVTTLITPILLKAVYKPAEPHKPDKPKKHGLFAKA